MINKDKIHEELMLYCIRFKFTQLFPPMTANDFQECEEKAKRMYLNNPSFNAAIKYFVAGVMDIINRNV